MLGQQAGGDGRRERAGERVGVRCGLVVHAGLDLAEILEAEPPAEDRGVGEQRLRLIGQVRGAPGDERPHRRGHEPLGVAREPPHAVDLLDHAAVAVGARHLLDDERDALGLRVHDRRAGLVDRTAEDRGDQRARLGLREPVDPHAPDQAHPLHVGDQVHRLGHERELLGADREQQEDRAVGDRAHDVAEQAQAVVVAPLEVVDQDRQRRLGRDGAERDGAQIEGAQEPAIGGQRREAGIVLARHRVEAPRDRLADLGAVPGGRRGGRRSHDRAREQERAAELLVGGDGDRREPGLRGHLARGQQQARLADAGLALERQPREPAGRRRGELLADRVLLGAAPDDRPRGPPHVQRHRGEGLEERRERRRARIGGGHVCGYPFGRRLRGYRWWPVAD